MIEITNKYMSIKEVAEFLGVDRMTVGRWNQEGKLEGQRVGREVIFHASDIVAFKKGYKKRAGRPRKNGSL